MPVTTHIRDTGDLLHLMERRINQIQVVAKEELDTYMKKVFTPARYKTGRKWTKAMASLISDAALIVVGLGPASAKAAVGYAKAAVTSINKVLGIYVTTGSGSMISMRDKISVAGRKAILDMSNRLKAKYVRALDRMVFEYGTDQQASTIQKMAAHLDFTFPNDPKSQILSPFVSTMKRLAEELDRRIVLLASEVYKQADQFKLAGAKGSVAMAPESWQSKESQDMGNYFKQPYVPKYCIPFIEAFYKPSMNFTAKPLKIKYQ